MRSTMMVIARSFTMLVLLAVIVVCTTAFQAPNPSSVSTRHCQPTTTTFSSSATSLGVFNKKKKEEEDLSFIETRDMTRAEMEDLNKQNEEIMQAELYGMTIFSLVISLPLLYLAWVAFFSETAEIAGDLSPYAQ